MRRYAPLGSGRRPTGAGSGDSPSCGGSMVMFGSSRSSQRGMYQVFSPSHVKNAGTSVIFTIKRVREDRHREQQAELLRDAVRGEDEGREDRAHDQRRGHDDAADGGDPVLDRLPRPFRPWTCSSRMRLMRKTM